MFVWRLSRKIYQDLSGVGGLRFAGRWNHKGLPIVYTSASSALTVLERRVHSQQQPKDDVLLKIEIPDHCIEQLTPMSAGWQDDYSFTRNLGSEWLRSMSSLCLRVPSVLVPDFNYLINPRHNDMGLVRVISITDYQYDPRLFLT